MVNLTGPYHLYKPLNRYGKNLDILGLVKILGAGFYTAVYEKKADPVKNISLADLTTEKIRYVSLSTLQELLEQAVDEERYEIAAMIRDEIDLRKR